MNIWLSCGDVRFWHEAAVRKCPLLRRLWGLSGHDQRRRFMSTRPRGAESLEAPILTQGTNQARRGSRKRPTGGRVTLKSAVQKMTVARLSKADAWASLPNWQENSACAAGDAQSGGGLGEMTRRKREITGLANEQDFPHLVELALPPGGFRSVFLEIDAFHRDRRIPVRRGRSRYEAEQFYIRFCFPDTATADAFRNRFGGECLTYALGKPKPRTSATSSDAGA